jgi:hypothetical protein
MSGPSGPSGPPHRSSSPAPNAKQESQSGSPSAAPAKELEAHAFHVNPALGGLVDDRPSGSHRALRPASAPAHPAPELEGQAFRVNPALGGLVGDRPSGSHRVMRPAPAPASPAAEKLEGLACHVNPATGGLVCEPVKPASAHPASAASPELPAFHVNPAVGGRVDAPPPSAKSAHHDLTPAEAERLKRNIKLHQLEESLHEGHVEPPTPKHRPK